MKKPKNHIFRGPNSKNSPFPFLVWKKSIPPPTKKIAVGVARNLLPHPHISTPTWNVGVLLVQIQYFPTTHTTPNDRKSTFQPEDIILGV